MKIAFQAIIFILCLNVATLIVDGYGLAPAGGSITPIDMSQVNAATDLNNLIAAGDTANPLFYDLQVALWGLWKISRTVVVGFPDAMAALQVPTLIAEGLYTVFIIAWATLIIEIRSGRDITDA